MLGFSVQDILLIILIVMVGGKPVLNVLSLIPGFAPLAKVLEKLTVNGDGKNGHADLKIMMTELQEHFNHDTTSALLDIKEAVKEHHEQEIPVLKEMNERLAILVDRSK